MAPLRRYLRITKYSVLECRIYLDNPALAQSWLLNPRDPILPKVIESVRPLVLPKLREERERERTKKGKKRSIKDVVTEDEFEVSIFLTETDTRHSLLHKQKHFRDKVQTKLTSNSSKLTGGESHDAAIDVDNADDNFVLQNPAKADDDDVVPIIREEDEDAIDLDAIPSIDETLPNAAASHRRPKRRRHTSEQGQDTDYLSEGVPDAQTIDTDSSDDEESNDDDYDTAVDGPPPPKRRREKAAARDTEARGDKKKLAVDISYEGFAIYGRVLCLVVKKRERGKTGNSAAMKSIGSGNSQIGRPGGQAMMENWITSTQLSNEADLGADDAS